MAWTDIQNGDTGLSVRTKINSAFSDLCVVGEIKHALLTEAQFQSEATSNWVLADGRDVTGSAYATLTGNTVIPDLRGQFLRGLDTTGIVDPDGAGRALGDPQDDAFESHLHEVRGNAVQYNWGGGYFTEQRSDSGNSSFNTQLSGDDETRPKNVSVNFFIKIN